MKKEKKFLCAILIALFTINNFTFAYLNVIDLGTLGGDHSGGGSINNNGQIAGFAMDSSGNYRACLFDSTGSGNNVDLGTANNVNHSYALSISSSGQIAGYVSDNQTYACACLFDPTGGGNNISLGYPSGSYGSEARSVNNDSQIVGIVQVDSYWHTRAYSFDKTGGGANVYLGSLASYDYSEASSNNDGGQIAGWCLTAGILPTLSVYQACLFDPSGNGANIGLGTLGGNSSRAYHINNNGQVVGYAKTSSGQEHACIFDPSGNGANIDLGVIEGGAYSSAHCISDNGQITGESDGHACLFDSTGQGNNIDLNNLIDPASGWTLCWADGINDNGWITGVGFHNGEPHTFLLVIPEPTTITILALGGLGILRRKIV